MRALQPGYGAPNACAGKSPRMVPWLRIDWFHMSWLFYLVFWVIVPLEVPSTRSWFYLAAALACFLPMYVLAHGVYPLVVRCWATVGMVLLAIVYVPVNPSAFGIYIFIAASLPELVETTRATYKLVALECLLILTQAMIVHLQSWEWTIAMGISTLTALNIQHFRTQRAADAKLRLAHDEIEQLAKTAERERIARDLHDVLGHTLSLIAIKSELASRLLTLDPERAAQELEEIQVTARRALAEVRQTVSGYRAQGLEAELQQMTASLAAAGVTVTGRPARVPRLPAQQEASLTLMLREAVTNIVRHAAARTCTIALVVDADGVLLEIADDGCGVAGLEGNGLRGMRERVRELGGTITVSCGPGTRLRIALPLRQASTLATGWVAETATPPATLTPVPAARPRASLG